MKRMIAMVCLALALAGCTDAQIGKFKALGNAGDIQCYSGPRLIYSGHSTGKVSNSDQSDGYYFEDAKTHQLVEVSGNCVITYDR